MATTSVRTIARQCLDVGGDLSAKRDVLLHASRTERSVRRALKIIHETRCPPAAPANLQVTGVGEGQISLAWIDRADNELGFRIRFRGQGSSGGAHEDTVTVDGSDQQSEIVKGLRNAFSYTFSVVAFNAAGESAPSNEASATTPHVPQKRSLLLERLIGSGFIVYAGQFPPAAGVPPRGRLLAVRFPRPLFAVRTFLNFVKFGTTAMTCNDPSKVVTLGEDEETTPQEMEQIFGQEEPPFGPGRTIRFLACLGTGEPVSTAPDFISIGLTVLLE